MIRKNIYLDQTYESLLRYENAIDEITRSTGITAMQVIDEAKVKEPTKLLNESMDFWDAKLDVYNLPPEQTIINDLRQNFQAKITLSDEVFIPVDETDINSTTSTDPVEHSPDANRVNLTLKILLHHKISGEEIRLNDIQTSVGKKPKKSRRERPYWTFKIEKLKVVIFVNNQAGNRTFVAGYDKESEVENL